jgi:prevent-host-death family protein
MAIMAILEPAMRTVNIAELKNKLSSYIGYAKAGETIVVRDRNRPVAKLVPFVPGDASEEDLALVAAGILRLPLEPGGLGTLWEMPWPGVEGNPVTQALLEERYAEDSR